MYVHIGLETSDSQLCCLLHHQSCPLMHDYEALKITREQFMKLGLNEKLEFAKRGVSKKVQLTYYLLETIVGKKSNMLFYMGGEGNVTPPVPHPIIGCLNIV